MREYETPLTAAPSDGGNLAGDLVRHAQQSPDLVLVRRQGPDGWTPVTAAELDREVRALAAGLIAAGIRRGDRVALISRTRYEWTVIDYAIWYAGAVSVPIYPTSPADHIAWILADAKACAVIAETPTQVIHRSSVPGLPPVQAWIIEEGGLDRLVAEGRDVPEEEIDARRTATTSADLATLVYTSGTTGHPQGCALTHANLDAELVATLPEVADIFGEESATLLFLPLTHIFARVVQLGCVRAGVTLGHNTDVRRLSEDLTGFQPTFLLTVPRVLEKLFNTTSQRAIADGRGRIFQHAVEAAIAWSRTQDTTGPSLTTKVRRNAFDRLVYARIREALGGQCRVVICGGAPLGERLAHFYRGIGVTVLEGYGLTETSAAVTVNTPEAQKIGTVGRPLPGTAIRVADDGELLVRGPQVLSGYTNADPAGASAVDEQGWFHTGDIGEIDDDGFVRVTGRKKEILVTAGGKNVAPALLENRIRSHPLIEQCMVVGDGQPYVAALITLDPDAVAQWATDHDRAQTEIAVVAADPDLRRQIQAAIDDANRTVSQAEAVRRFTVLTTAWSEETGELTASLKVRRNVVMATYADEIEALYAR